MRSEGAAQNDRCAEEAEVTLGDMNAVNLLRAVSGEVEAGTCKVVGGHFFEDARLLLPDMKLGNRANGIAAIGRGEQKFDDAICIGIGERLKQNRIDHGEDGRVGSDAEGQGGDGGDSEAGVLEKHVQRMLDVAPEIGHKVRSICRENAWNFIRRASILAKERPYALCRYKHP